MGTCDGLAMKAQRPKPQHLETSDTLCEAAQLPTQCKTQKGEGGWVNNLELEPPPAWNRRSVGETPSRQKRTARNAGTGARDGSCDDPIFGKYVVSLCEGQR